MTRKSRDLFATLYKSLYKEKHKYLRLIRYLAVSIPEIPPGHSEEILGEIFEFVSLPVIFTIVRRLWSGVARCSLDEM